MNRLFKITILILISSSFSFAEADGPDHYSVQGVASNDVLWMHPKPDYRSKKIGKIPYNGSCIKHLKCTGNISYAEYQKMSPREKDQLKYRSKWCKVVYRGTVGWVNGKFLREGNCP